MRPAQSRGSSVFGSALNLNIHFHRLLLDGAYLTATHPPVFRRIAAPSARELQALVAKMAERIGRSLERQGLLARDGENGFLTLQPAAGSPMDDLIGHSLHAGTGIEAEQPTSSNGSPAT